MQELIELAKGVTKNGRRLLAGTSYNGTRVPDNAVCAASDLLTMHGNRAHDPTQLEQMVAQARTLPSYRPMPVVLNEDYNYGFDAPRNNFSSAVASYASWGYYDPGDAVDDTGHVVDPLAFGNYASGYQSPPVDWRINTPRKQAFFQFLRGVTAGEV